MNTSEEEHFAVIYEESVRLSGYDDDPYYKRLDVYLPFESEDKLKNWLETDGTKVKHRVLRCIPQAVSRNVSYSFSDR
jgi:hypothetical protein